jgi:hypothetical protein
MLTEVRRTIVHFTFFIMIVPAIRHYFVLLNQFTNGILSHLYSHSRFLYLLLIPLFVPLLIDLP